MDRSTELKLVAVTYTSDSIGQLTPSETKRTVFCNLSSVTRAEFYDAGKQGLRAEYRATMFEPDYAGEEIAELNNVRYGIYRTYRTDGELIELYLERKTGLG